MHVGYYAGRQLEFKMSSNLIARIGRVSPAFKAIHNAEIVVVKGIGQRGMGFGRLYDLQSLRILFLNKNNGITKRLY